MPRLMTSMPITTPPGKATFRASLKLRVAAWVVRAFAAVAIFMPPKPHSDDRTAPVTKARAVLSPSPSMSPFRNTARTTATPSTKMESVRYSRLRKAIAPSEMWFWMVFIRSLPRSFARTRLVRTPAKRSPTPPAPRAQSA